jgi:hypothetical protein
MKARPSVVLCFPVKTPTGTRHGEAIPANMLIAWGWLRVLRTGMDGYGELEMWGREEYAAYCKAHRNKRVPFRPTVVAP